MTGRGYLAGTFYSQWNPANGKVWARFRQSMELADSMV